MANVENTGFWMSPSMQPSNAISVLKPSKKKKVAKLAKVSIFICCLEIVRRNK